MKNDTRILLVFIVVFSMCLSPFSTLLACTSDSQCHGDRICENGTCTYPDNGLKLACSLYGDIPGTIDTGLSEKSVEDIVREVGNAVGITRYPEILTGPVPNALARISRGKRQIIYNRKFLANLKSKADGNWKVRFVLAHELAHHFAAHVYLDDSVGHANEYEADQIAAKMLHVLGAKKVQIIDSLNVLPGEGTDKHPSAAQRKARLDNFLSKLELEEKSQIEQKICEQKTYHYWDGSRCIINCPQGLVAQGDKCVAISCASDEFWDGYKCAKRCPASNQRWNGSSCVAINNPVEISSFRANDRTINSGEEIRLSWNTANAQECVISDDVNYDDSQVKVTGRMTFYPDQTTEFTLTCYGSDGSEDSRSTTVTVRETQNAPYCCDIWGNRRCVIMINPGPPGSPCFCAGQGTGVMCN